jgi:hypothetical protein
MPAGSQKQLRSSNDQPVHIPADCFSQKEKSNSIFRSLQKAIQLCPSRDINHSFCFRSKELNQLKLGINPAPANADDFRNDRLSIKFFDKSSSRIHILNAD